MSPESVPRKYRFGEFELDWEGGELRQRGSPLRLQPQPFKLLFLLVRRSGALVTRDEIRGELWPDGTHVDFDQAVNFCIRQIRDVLRDQADRPVFIQTVPKRGYRFIAPVETGESPARRGSGGDGITVRLQKALWANIAELRLAEERRKRNLRIAMGAALALAAAAVVYLALKG
jgi:DNA-binding winged helix-turn-helix (wHTH) protein